MCVGIFIGMIPQRVEGIEVLKINMDTHPKCVALQVGFVSKRARRLNMKESILMENMQLCLQGAIYLLLKGR